MAKRKKVVEDLDEKRRKFQRVAADIQDIPAEEFLEENFLPYAWSYNLDRALVDITGLKPVQRRILFALYKAGVSPGAPRAKMTELAGLVMPYHPHGDSSVADALKNLAKGHVFRVPVIDGKGDFGGPGKPGAAPRYLEARLNQAGWLNVQELGEHAVRMVPNFDGKREEPSRMPVRWPVSVINGGSGLAIAYSSNMPSHNPTEIMEACSLLLRNPSMPHEDLAEVIKGPDFNLGGVIATTDGIKEYLKTGSGSFKIRGAYDVTPGPRGTHRIEFYELPFGVYQEKVLEDIHKAIDSGHFKDVSSFKNLSDLKHPVRVVVDTKPGANVKRVIQDLFRYTSLESNFSANITTIVDNRPQKSSMRDLLLSFIEFRKQCVANKSTYGLNKKEARIHILNGLAAVLLDIDKAIAIIRSADDATYARTALMEAFTLDETQADHVLSLQLRRLTKMDQVELDNEKDKLLQETAYLKSLLTDEEVLIQHLEAEFAETLKIIGDERKTEILGFTEEEYKAQEKSFSKEAKNTEKNLPTFITRFQDGSLLRTPEPFVYEMGAKKFTHGPIAEQLKMKAQESLVVVGSDGVAHRVPVSYLVEGKASSAKDLGITRGPSVSTVAIAKGDPLKTDVGLLLGTRQGEVKLVKPDLPVKEEFVVFNLSEGDSILDGRWLGRTLNGAGIVSITREGFALVYDASVLRPAGAPAGGVKSQKLAKEGDEVITFRWVPSLRDETLVLSQSNGAVKLTLLNDIPKKGKGSQGVVLQKFLKGETHLVTAAVGKDVALMLKGKNVLINLPPVTKRAASGVALAVPALAGSTFEPAL